MSFLKVLPSALTDLREVKIPFEEGVLDTEKAINEWIDAEKKNDVKKKDDEEKKRKERK